MFGQNKFDPVGLVLFDKFTILTFCLPTPSVTLLPALHLYAYTQALSDCYLVQTWFSPIIAPPSKVSPLNLTASKDLTHMITWPPKASGNKQKAYFYSSCLDDATLPVIGTKPNKPKSNSVNIDPNLYQV